MLGVMERRNTRIDGEVGEGGEERCDGGRSLSDGVEDVGVRDEVCCEWI